MHSASGAKLFEMQRQRRTIHSESVYTCVTPQDTSFDIDCWCEMLSETNEQMRQYYSCLREDISRQAFKLQSLSLTK